MTAVPEVRRRSPAGVLGDALLWVASIAGVICILVVLAAVVFHVTLIMFKTGSMEPTIPTGSLAVVHQIPASEIRVGDVVTVDRDGQLPVTHRVTSVEGSGSTRTLTLRGDANPTDDAAPYVVSTVRIVWLSVPGWASVVVWFSNPVVLGGLTLAATALVTWAFWPRDERHGRRRARRRAGPATAAGTTLLIAVALTGVAPAPPAQAAEVETVIHGTYLTLTSVIDPVLSSSMTPGDPVDWQIGVDAVPPDPGVVHLGVAAAAPVPDRGDFSVRIQACPVRWVAGACAGASGEWLPPTDLVDAVAPTTAFGAHEVGAMTASPTAQVWLLVSVTRTSAALPSPAQLRLWAWGASSGSVGGSTTTPGGLAFTGAANPFPPALLAGVAILGGLALAAAATLRRRLEDDHD